MADHSGARATFEDIPNNTDKSWWKDPCLRRNVLYSVGCMLCPFYLGYDQSLLNGLQALPQWLESFDSPSGQWLGLISACVPLPGVVFGFPTAWAANHWGNKICVLVGAGLIIAGAIWNALSPDVYHFIASRLIVGVGGAITKVSAPALLQETAHPRLRAALGYMYYGFYYVGSLLSALVSIIGLYIPGSWGWRLPCMLMVVGPAFVILILFTAPESPRFMVKKSQNAKALEMLAKHHANGDRNDALVKWELSEIEQALEEEEMNNTSSYLDFFKTKGNRKRLAISIAVSLGTNWVGNGIVSYYLSPVLKSVGVDQPAQLLGINAGLAIWNLILAQGAAFKVESYGVRPLFLTSTIGMILSYAFVMGFSAGFEETSKASLGIAAIPFLFFFYGFYDIAWTPLNFSYCAVIMPYNLRTKGLAIFLAVQNGGNAFNQFVNPIALDAIAWKYYAVYIAIDSLYVLLIYFWFPETKKLSLEEIALVFDYSTKDGRTLAAAAFDGRAGAHTEMQKQVEGRESAVHVETESAAKN